MLLTENVFGYGVDRRFLFWSRIHGWRTTPDVPFEIDATVTLAALLTIRVLVTLATQIEISGTKTVLLDRFHPGKHFWILDMSCMELWETWLEFRGRGNLIGVSA